MCFVLRVVIVCCPADNFLLSDPTDRADLKATGALQMAQLLKVPTRLHFAADTG
jgi:hypothetical protein